MSIAEVVDLYGRQGFGAIAITDHLCEKNNLIGKVSHGLSYSLSKEIFTEYMNTIRVEAARAKAQYDMLVIPGFEITKNSFINHRSAHILILGIEEYISPELDVDQILITAKSMGALTIAAHPFHTGEFEFQTLHLWSRREELKHLIDVWEMNYRKKIYPEVLNSGLPVIANSDMHHLGHFNSWKNKIYAEKNQQSLFEAIRLQKIDFFLDALAPNEAFTLNKAKTTLLPALAANGTASHPILKGRSLRPEFP
jgi:predicted metal-dependent phosphoesterase TrpH